MMRAQAIFGEAFLSASREEQDSMIAYAEVEFEVERGGANGDSK